MLSYFGRWLAPAREDCQKDTIMISSPPIWFTGNPLDRVPVQRKDPDWVTAQLLHKEARLALLGKDGVALNMAAEPAVWHGRERLAAHTGTEPPVLLGLDQGIPCFAAALDRASTEEFKARNALLPLRTLAARIGPVETTILGQAMWLLDWHRTHRFCPASGAPTEMADGGAKRVEPETGRDHFPRVNPVAIVLPVFGEECLLARSPHFYKGLYSAPAGYMEPGENLEECAAREIWEETGLTLSDVSYQFSQPWPFSASLMTGFIGTATGRNLSLDAEEIEDAFWLSRRDLSEILSGDKKADFLLPPEFAIARRLMERWVAR